MGLESVDNDELLMNGTEQDLFPSQVGLKNYATTIFFDELIPPDEITIRVYKFDKFAAVEKLYRSVLIQGLLTDPNVEINWLPTESYRVSCQQTVGTLKTITWELLTA